jgi:hypothetical protein
VYWSLILVVTRTSAPRCPGRKGSGLGPAVALLGPCALVVLSWCRGACTESGCVDHAQQPGRLCTRAAAQHMCCLSWCTNYCKWPRCACTCTPLRRECHSIRNSMFKMSAVQLLASTPADHPTGSTALLTQHQQHRQHTGHTGNHPAAADVM